MIKRERQSIYINYCSARWKIVDVTDVLLPFHHPASEPSKYDEWCIMSLPLTVEVSQL